MDDDDAKHILLTIGRTLLENYPFKEGDTVDPRYAMAFGLLSGIAAEAVQAVNQDRPMRVKLDSPWHPPETAPKDKAFLLTTAGPQVDICVWDDRAEHFSDYFYKQRIPHKWPFFIGWKAIPEAAVIKDTEAETRAANGWPEKPDVAADG